MSGSFIRKLRGALGIALTWGVAWGLLFTAIGTVIGIFDPDSIDPGEEPWRIGLFGSALGATAGLGFATLLSLADGRRKLRQLSAGRAAIWGAIGSAVVPLISGADPSMVIIFAPIGAGIAAGTVAIAKRGELAAPEEQPRLGA